MCELFVCVSVCVCVCVCVCVHVLPLYAYKSSLCVYTSVSESLQCVCLRFRVWRHKPTPPYFLSQTKMATPPVLVLVLLLVPLVSAQSVRTQNGSLYFEIGGATLALTGSVSSAGSGQAGGTLVTQNDLAAAIANSVQQTQPQVNKQTHGGEKKDIY